VLIRSLDGAEPFTTADGSTIRELCGLPSGGTVQQSLAEATLESGRSTDRHYHAETEEIYFVLAGSGEMELDGERAAVGPGDAVPIRPGAWHQIRNTADERLRFLCCCAPAYRHEDTFFE
jgi:mannose-6-phosphate isomerase-like protein (cupin superfamily)